MPKCLFAEVSLCQNVHRAKIPRAKKSLHKKVHGENMSMCWNANRAEMSVMKCLCGNVPGRNVRFRNDGKPKITFNLRLLEYKVSPYDPSKHLKARGLYGERIEKIKYL